MLDLLSISPLIVWGTFTRLMGLMLAWAIGQLYFQAPLLAGKNGITPIDFNLNSIKRDFAFGKHFFYFPTLLWINHSDAMMRFLIVSGVGAGFYIFFGGTHLWLAFLYCYLVYLSFDLPIGLSYPWDSLLFETCLLCIFLPDIPFLPHWTAVELPSPILIFLFQFLLFRVLFGFGKFKFSKFNWKNSGYFRGFMFNAPLPSPLAPIIHNAPNFIFLGILWFAFLTEIILPFFMFVPGLPRVFTACCIILLMIGIQLFSNFGFFNLLTIIVVITLFDHQSTIWNDWQFATNEPFDWLLLGLLTFYLITGLTNLIFNSWCCFTWMHWPSALLVRNVFFKELVHFLRILSRWRLVHAYGVFPPQGSPSMKLVPIIEGSKDGINWEAYHYKYSLSHPEDLFRFVAPYHPRIEHSFFYCSFDITDSNFNNIMVGRSIPYDFTKRGGMEPMIQAILEGRKNVNKNFKHAPFSENSPPKWIRVGQYWFEPKKKTERKNKKDRWHMRLAEIHKMPRKLEDDFEIKKTCFPELFHWDFHFWRMRTKAASDWKNWSVISDFNKMLAEINDGLSITQEYFWIQFPKDLQLKKADWSQVKMLARTWEKETDFQNHQTLHRYWNRMRIVLSLRCMNLYLEKRNEPLSDANFFAFGMLLNYVIMQGKTAVEEVWQNPESLLLFEKDFSLEKGFYIETVFRLDTVISQCRKLQWQMVAAPPDSNPLIPGYIKLYSFLHKVFPEECFNAWPKMEYNEENGNWTLSHNKHMTVENAANHLRADYFSIIKSTVDVK